MLYIQSIARLFNLKRCTFSNKYKETKKIPKTYYVSRKAADRIDVSEMVRAFEKVHLFRREPPRRFAYDDPLTHGGKDAPRTEKE